MLNHLSMPRKRQPNPSKSALYMRQYRESKLTPEQKANRLVKERIKAVKESPEFVKLNAKAVAKRRREVYRAWKVLEANKPLTFRGEEMTTEQAVAILEGGGRVNLLKRGRKPSKNKLVTPRMSHYKTRDQINDKIYDLALKAGLKPATVPVLVEAKETFPKHFQLPSASAYHNSNTKPQPPAPATPIQTTTPPPPPPQPEPPAPEPQTSSLPPSPWDDIETDDSIFGTFQVDTSILNFEK